MSTGAYVLVKFDNRDKLLPAVQTVGGLNDVSKWDAVDGHHNLVIKLSNNDKSLLEQIQKLDGCVEMTACDLTNDTDKDVTLSEEFSYSYLFIETERYQQNAVQSSLERDDAVVFCSPACHF